MFQVNGSQTLDENSMAGWVGRHLLLVAFLGELRTCNFYWIGQAVASAQLLQALVSYELKMV